MAKSQHSHWRRAIWILIGLTVVIGVSLEVRHITSRAPPANAAPPAVSVTAATATRQDVPEIIDAIGTVQSIDSVSVQPRVTGTIEKIEFSPGQYVKKGQELFLIDPRPYQAALDQAKAQLTHDQGVLAQARMDLQRYQTLAQQRSIAAQTAQDQIYVVQQNQATVQLDQANIEMAQLNLEYCHIVSPISGRAGTLQIDLGNLVGPTSAQPNSAVVSRPSANPGPSAGSSPNPNPTGSGNPSPSANTSPSPSPSPNPSASGYTSGTANSSSPNTQLSTISGATSSAGGLVSIEQTKPIYVSFSIPQTVFNEVARNQANAPLEVDAYAQAGKLAAKGKLTVINNQVNTATGTVALQATFANLDNALWPGEYVSVQLTVGMRRNVVTIPASAVMVGPNGNYVYVIGSDNKVTRVDVQQTARRGGIAVIAKGVSAGQRVVATGQYRLDNGAVVAIDQSQAHQAAAD